MFRFALVSLFFIGAALAAQPKLKPEIMKEPFIQGGSSASSGQFPYQVSLRNAFNSHFCGGSIINARWVLTAAHCTIDDSASNVKVYVGSHLLSGGIKHDVTEIRNHQSYNRQSLANDVATLRVSPNIALNNLAQAVPLINRVVDNEVLVVSGWGRTSTSGPVPTNLQYVQTTTIPLATCQRQISANSDNVCAFSKYFTWLSAVCSWRSYHYNILIYYFRLSQRRCLLRRQRWPIGQDWRGTSRYQLVRRQRMWWRIS